MRKIKTRKNVYTKILLIEQQKRKQKRKINTKNCNQNFEKWEPK